MSFQDLVDTNLEFLNKSDPNPYSSIRFEDHLPPGYIAFLRTSPVIGFLHIRTRTVSTNLEIMQAVRVIPITPGIIEGDVELIQEDDEILTITSAAPFGIAHFLYIRGPEYKKRVLVGYQYPDMSPLDWEQLCLLILDDFTKTREQYDKEKADIEAGIPQHFRIKAKILNEMTGELKPVTDPELLQNLGDTLNFDIEDRINREAEKEREKQKEQDTDNEGESDPGEDPDPEQRTS
jgi:hypothetical protein